MLSRMRAAMRVRSKFEWMICQTKTFRKSSSSLIHPQPTQPTAHRECSIETRTCIIYHRWTEPRNMDTGELAVVCGCVCGGHYEFSSTAESGSDYKRFRITFGWTCASLLRPRVCLWWPFGHVSQFLVDKSHRAASVWVAFACVRRCAQCAWKVWPFPGTVVVEVTFGARSVLR